MALNLASELAAAQDSQDRRPLIDLISNPFITSIPFVGQFMTNASVSESGPDVRTHSTGRIIGVYMRSDSKIDYFYTDANRQEFTHVLLSITGILVDVSLSELASGDIGILILRSYGGNYYLDYKIVDIGGAVVSSGNISSWATSIYFDGPFVCTLNSPMDLITNQVNLSWNASTDNIGVVGYKVYRNGVLIATTPNTFYVDTVIGRENISSYVYTVSAYDAAGNESAQSTNITVYA